MGWDKIEEILLLCVKVRKETETRIDAVLCANSLFVGVNPDKRRKYDMSYVIYREEVLKDTSERDYRAAKEHLERLLEEKK